MRFLIRELLLIRPLIVVCIGVNATRAVRRFVKPKLEEAQFTPEILRITHHSCRGGSSGRLKRWEREFGRIECTLQRLDSGVPLTLDDLIFANHDGKPIDPSVLTHNFTRIVRQAGLGRVRFHDLRHTFASLMLMAGVHPKIVSEALGHASVAFTMDTYSHIISGMQEDAMALLDGVLPSGVPPKSEKEVRYNDQQ